MPWTELADREKFRAEGQKFLALQEGVMETPFHSNRTKYGVWYGLDGYPWCGQFVSYVYGHVCAKLRLANPLRGIQSTKGFAHVTSAAAKMPDLWTVKPGQPLLPMDIVMWDHDNNPGGPGHTGIIYKVNTLDSFIAMEGNTRSELGFSAEELRSGGTVAYHTHNLTDRKHGRLLKVVRPYRRYSGTTG